MGAARRDSPIVRFGMKPWCKAGWLVGMCLVIGMLAGCHHPPDDAQVRTAISQGAAAARSADAGKLANVLSDGFDGNDGAIDKRTLVNMLRLARLRGESVKVLLGPISIERRGQRLMASFLLTISGGRGWLSRHTGVFHVHTAWRDEDGDWRCYSATWKRVLR